MDIKSHKMIVFHFILCDFIATLCIHGFYKEMCAIYVYHTAVYKKLSAVFKKRWNILTGKKMYLKDNFPKIFGP